MDPKQNASLWNRENDYFPIHLSFFFFFYLKEEFCGVLTLIFAPYFKHVDLGLGVQTKF